ncbi:hypothetical protein D3C87_1224290 [compost metagenome]
MASACSRVRFSAVVPGGTGCPSARNAAALPMWTSATSSIAAPGHQMACSGSSHSVSPATSTAWAPKACNVAASGWLIAAGAVSMACAGAPSDVRDRWPRFFHHCDRLT